MDHDGGGRTGQFGFGGAAFTPSELTAAQRTEAVFNSTHRVFPAAKEPNCLQLRRTRAPFSRDLSVSFTKIKKYDVPTGMFCCLENVIGQFRWITHENFDVL